MTFLFSKITRSGEINGKKFCTNLLPAYFHTIKPRKNMKKMLYTLAALIMMASCSKQTDDLAKNAPDVPETPKTKFFSQVMRYNDGRQPGVDTVWTMRLESQDLVNTYQALDGYLYEETSTYRKVGVLYAK